MPTCFVIQPFDRSVFEKRYGDVFEPAIRAADLEPYRVDRDPGASIPIEAIEAGIRNSAVCLADITTDNPNVWFELGFALASGRDTALVCAATRQRFPFDVQHRNVIVYETDSSRDFEVLSGRITERIKAILSKETTIGAAAQLASPVAPVEGLASHEFVTLVTIAENADGPRAAVSAYAIRQDMERAGFTRIAVAIGLASLLGKDLVSHHEATDDFGQPYPTYRLTDAGWSWLLNNKDKLVLKVQTQAHDEAPPDSSEITDEDIPL